MIQRLVDQLEKQARDLTVLETVIEHHPIGIVRLSKETGIPEHKVRYSLRMLENDDLIEATQQGAVPVEGIEETVEEINASIDGLVGRIEAMGEEAVGEVADATAD
jgi:predicted transcriptional regulator